MSDIFKQIQELQEQFSNLFETGTTVNRWADAAQKRIDDNPYMGITSRGKEELERLKEIAKLPRDGKAANEIKKEAAKAEAEAARKGIEADLKGNKAERDRQEGIAWKKGLVAGDNKGGCFTKWRAKSPKMNDNNSYNENTQETLISETSDERAKAANAETTRRYDDARNALAITKAMIKNGKDFYTKDEIKELKKKVKSQEKNFKKASDNRIRDNKNQFNRDKRLMNDNNSYNEIVSQIMDLKEAFSNLFEVEGLGDPAVDVPPSQNKIKKDRKTKDGKVEVVSVEDELFPYEGNKREQYRQKILDTINNMIQGTATLEDLLQIVRQKKAPLKEAMEVLENLLNEDSPFAVKRRIADKFKDKIDSKFSNAYDEVKKSLQKMNDKDKEVRAKGGETVAFTGDKITDFSKDPEVRKKQEEFNQATDDMHKASANCDKVHHLRNLVKHYQTPEMADESLKEAVELLENLINKRDQYHISKKSVADAEAEFKDSPLRHAQSLERMRFGYNNGKDDRKDVAKYRIGMHDGAKHQAHAYEPEYRCDSDTTPCDRAEETKNRIKRAHGAFDEDEEADESLKEALKILELFDRPDLLNDIDTALGSPVKKAFKKAIGSIAAPKKRKES